MNVLFAAVAIILAAVFLFFSPVMIFDLLSWTRESARNSDDSSLPQSVLSTELQNRMKSFLMRTSADEKQIGNECVVASHPSATQSHGSIHHFTLKTDPAVSVYTTSALSALSALSAGNKCGRRWVAGAVDGRNRPV